MCCLHIWKKVSSMLIQAVCENLLRAVQNFDHSCGQASKKAYI